VDRGTADGRHGAESAVAPPVPVKEGCHTGGSGVAWRAAPVPGCAGGGDEGVCVCGWMGECGGCDAELRPCLVAWRGRKRRGRK